MLTVGFNPWYRNNVQSNNISERRQKNGIETTEKILLFLKQTNTEAANISTISIRRLKKRRQFFEPQDSVNISKDKT